MIERKTWDEFRQSGLLWWINMILHTFGWAIAIDYLGDTCIKAYPVRVKYRGFEPALNDQGYEKVTSYLASEIKNLQKDIEVTRSPGEYYP